MSAPTGGLPTAAPAAQGVDARGIARFLDHLEGAANVEPHAITVVRHGHTVATGHWAPYTPDRLRLLYSLSKSFTSTAVGLAAAEGLLTLDDLVVDHFPAYADDAADDRVRRLRVRHLLAMSSGHAVDTWPAVVAAGLDDPVQAFLRLPPDAEPGTLFRYNQSATYTAAAIVQDRSGSPLGDFLRPRLFDPLGVGPVAWTDQPGGRALGFSGLHATHDAIARLGQLYLQHGRWDGRALLPPEWVAEATRHQADTPDEPNPDWRQGYGFQFWPGRHGFRGDGAYGQYCIVLPEQDAVVALNTATVDMQAVLDAVYDLLLPAFRDAPLHDASVQDATLAQRLASLALPTPSRSPRPSHAAAWDGVTLEPGPGARRVQPSLTGLRTGADGTLTFVEGDTSFAVRLGAGWQVQDAEVEPTGARLPVATAGGWLEDGSLRVHLRFLETPHTAVVVAPAGGGAFRLLWPTIPLHVGHLHDLRAPDRRS